MGFMIRNKVKRVQIDDDGGASIVRISHKSRMSSEIDS